MFIAKNKSLMVLLLLVFVGQVTAASAISCQTNQHNQSMMMDHSKHSMNNQANDSSSSQTDDCCADSSSCPMSGCVTFAIPTLYNATSTVTISSDIFQLPINLAFSQPLTSLYRPPILS